MEKPFNAYQGKSPYVFVSYSHQNTDIVYAIIEKLYNDDFRIWYDEGIEPGVKYAARLYGKLKKADILLVFISPQSMSSRHVINEIGIAFEEKVRILPVLLDENTSIPEDVKYYLGSTQFFTNININNIEESYLTIAETLPDSVQNSFAIVDDVLTESKEYIKEAIIPESVKTIAKGVFKNATLLEKVVLNNVEVIEDEAFRNCTSLRNIDFSKKIRKIGNSTFRDCTALKSVVFEKTEIDNLNCGERCFENCSNLETVVLPGSLGEIPSGMFNSCSSIKEISLPLGISILGESCFSSCTSLEKIDFPNTVTKIDDMAFNSCSNLHDVIIPEGVTRFGKNVFRNCTKLIKISLPRSLYSIINNPFKGCKNLEEILVHKRNRYFKSENSILYNKNKSNIISCAQGTLQKTLNIPDSVTDIGSGSFFGCDNIETVNLPDTIINIYGEAFAECFKITTITIPESVSRIDDNVFKMCLNLIKIVFENDCRDLGWGIFNNCNDKLVVHCKKDTAIHKYCVKYNIEYEEYTE